MTDPELIARIAHQVEVITQKPVTNGQVVFLEHPAGVSEEQWQRCIREFPELEPARTS